MLSTYTVQIQNNLDDIDQKIKNLEIALKENKEDKGLLLKLKNLLLLKDYYTQKLYFNKKEDRYRAAEY